MKDAFIAALLFSPICLFAQAQEEVDATKHEKVKVIRLDAKHYLPDGAPLLRLSGIKVIVLCADTSKLGYVQKGMANKAVRAVPDKPYTPYLQDFVNEVFGGVYVASGRRMLWVIKDLRINEATQDMQEHAFVRLKADAYLPVNNSDTPAYRLLAAFDRVFVKSGGNLANKHDEQIAEAIQQFYLSCEDAAGVYSGDTPLTEAAIVAKALEPFKSPIYHDPAYKEGIYRTYEEFLTNAPSITQVEIEKKKQQKMAVYAMSGDTVRKEVTEMWGVCYKGVLYKYDDRELVPIMRQGNTFIVSRYLRDLNSQKTFIFWEGMASVLAGGVPGSDGSTGMHLARWVPEAAEYGAATTVDVESGELVF